MDSQNPLPTKGHAASVWNVLLVLVIVVITLTIISGVMVDVAVDGLSGRDHSLENEISGDADIFEKCVAAGNEMEESSDGKRVCIDKTGSYIYESYEE